jgi:monoamine oxidase
MSADIDVAIVGGGAAGIGAARRLAQAGLSAVLLEASSRLGGRAWTHQIASLPLDLGCGWFHSADRNAWVGIAEAAGIAIERSIPAWGVQFRDLGFPKSEQVSARRAFADWMQRLGAAPPPSDRAADALDPASEWNSYIRAIVGFISGARLEQLSIADYLAYDNASTDSNWRTPSGFGFAAGEKLSAELAAATLDSGDIYLPGRRCRGGRHGERRSARAHGDSHGLDRGAGWRHAGTGIGACAVAGGRKPAAVGSQ